MGFLFTLARFVVSAGTCASFLPALRLIYARRRHFECFVGVLQLVAAIMFTSTDALGCRVLLTTDDWHMMSDIATSTYICLLCIHLLGLRSDETMVMLRYVAFACSWVAKLADGWGSVAFEALVYAFFLLPALTLMLQGLATGPVVPLFPAPPPLAVRAFLDRKLSYDSRVAVRAIGSGAAGLACFACAEVLGDRDELRIGLAFAHCMFGAAAYYMWQFLPCYDRSDDIPMFR